MPSRYFFKKKVWVSFYFQKLNPQKNCKIISNLYKYFIEKSTGHIMRVLKLFIRHIIFYELPTEHYLYKNCTWAKDILKLHAPVFNI